MSRGSPSPAKLRGDDVDDDAEDAWATPDLRRGRGSPLVDDETYRGQRPKPPVVRPEARVGPTGPLRALPRLSERDVHISRCRGGVSHYYDLDAPVPASPNAGR